MLLERGATRPSESPLPSSKHRGSMEHRIVWQSPTRLTCGHRTALLSGFSVMPPFPPTTNQHKTCSYCRAPQSRLRLEAGGCLAACWTQHCWFQASGQQSLTAGLESSGQAALWASAPSVSRVNQTMPCLSAGTNPRSYFKVLLFSSLGLSLLGASTFPWNVTSVSHSVKMQCSGLERRLNASESLLLF